MSLKVVRVKATGEELFCLCDHVIMECGLREVGALRATSLVVARFVVETWVQGMVSVTSIKNRGLLK